METKKSPSTQSTHMVGWHRKGKDPFEGTLDAVNHVTSSQTHRCRLVPKKVLYSFYFGFDGRINCLLLLPNLFCENIRPCHHALFEKSTTKSPKTNRGQVLGERERIRLPVDITKQFLVNEDTDVVL